MTPFVFSPWAWREPDMYEPDLIEEQELTEEARRGRIPLAGYDVEAIDGGIGKVDDTGNEIDAAHIVVDTGPWIFGRKVLLPAGTVQWVDHRERKVYLDRSREQIRHSPDFDPELMVKPEYRAHVGSYFEQSYRTSPPLM